MSTFRAGAKVSQNLQVSVQFVRPDHALRVVLVLAPKKLDHSDDLKCLVFANAGWIAISVTGFREHFCRGLLDIRWNYPRAMRGEMTDQNFDTAPESFASKGILKPVFPGCYFDLLGDYCDRFS